MSSSPNYDRAALRDSLKQGVIFAEKAIETHELAGIDYLVLRLVLQHVSIGKRRAPGSQEHHHAMSNAAGSLADRFTSLVTADHYAMTT